MAPTLATNRYAALLSESEGADEARDEGPEAKALRKERKKKRALQTVTAEDAVAADEGGDRPDKLKRKRRRKASAVNAAAPPDNASLPSNDGAEHAPPAAADRPDVPAGTGGNRGQSGGQPAFFVKAASTATPMALGAKKVLPGGVTIEVTRAAKEGSRVAAKGDVVKLLYEGRLPAKDNKSFDKGDIDFVLGDGSMVVGFDRGVAGMAVGERRLINIPSRFGYGKKGKKPKVPPNSDLVFDVIMTSVGCDWTDMTFSSMSNARREASRRRGKKPRKT